MSCLFSILSGHCLVVFPKHLLTFAKTNFNCQTNTFSLLSKRKKTKNVIAHNTLAKASFIPLEKTSVSNFAYFNISD